MKSSLGSRLLLLLIGLAPINNSVAYEKNSHLSLPIMVFVSFSMNEASLKQWMQQAERIHAPVVIRGLLDHSFKKTIQKMAELTRDNHGGMQLDPTLFRKFQIEQVPAVVVFKEANCPSSQSCVEDFDVVYGNVTLDYALQTIIDQHDGVSSIASVAISTLRGASHA
jgi:type-F conjugative transfer system pilin assembly protein TrbC